MGPDAYALIKVASVVTFLAMAGLAYLTGERELTYVCLIIAAAFAVAIVGEGV